MINIICGAFVLGTVAAVIVMLWFYELITKS